MTLLTDVPSQFQDASLGSLCWWLQIFVFSIALATSWSGYLAQNWTLWLLGSRQGLGTRSCMGPAHMTMYFPGTGAHLQSVCEGLFSPGRVSVFPKCLHGEVVPFKNS